MFHLDTPLAIPKRIVSVEAQRSRAAAFKVLEVYAGLSAGVAPVFADKLFKQELDGTTPYFDIPEPVLEMHRVYRPSPLVRAYNLERALNTSGSHKLNSVIAQAYYASVQGSTNVTTEIERRMLAADPTNFESLGTAISEAVERFAKLEATRPRPADPSLPEMN